MALGAIWAEGVWDEAIWDTGIWEASEPSLTSVTAINIEATETDVVIVTDKISGTAYVVISTSSTQPTSVQIKAGQDHTGASAVASGNASVVAFNVYIRNLGTLTSGNTYYAHAIQTDSSANDSNIVSTAAFVAQAADGRGMVLDFARDITRNVVRSRDG